MLVKIVDWHGSLDLMNLYEGFSPTRIPPYAISIEVNSLKEAIAASPGEKAIVNKLNRENDGFDFQLCVTKHHSWGQR